MPLGLRLQGPLDTAALRRSLRALVDRHEVLRSRFVTIDGEPRVELIAAEQALVLHEHDFGSEPDAPAALQALVALEGSEPFDLSVGPLLRVRLVRLSAQDHALLLTQHHIVSDGWSMGVLLRDLGALYGAFASGGENPLAPLSIQYADYAAWQRQWLSGERLAQQAAFWRETLSGAPPQLDLPTDRPRPGQQDFAGGYLPFELDAATGAGLDALSRRHGTTLFMTLLSAWAAVLCRLSGQDEVLIGTSVAGRVRLELEPLLGLFVNTLVLRIAAGEAVSPADLIGRVRRSALAAQDHQDLPFEQVVEIINPPRSTARSPLFQAMFSWQEPGEDSGLKLHGLSVGPLGGGAGSAKFDLSLEMTRVEGRIVGGLSYATALFDEATIARHAGYLRAMLGAMVADDGQSLSRIDLLSAAERRLLVEDWNATAADYPQDQCIHELFEAQAARHPDAIALVHEDRVLSYGEFDARANRLAHHLRRLGVGPDRRVAICVERSAPMVVGLLAILKAGGGYVPLDPSYPRDRLAFMLEDSAPVALLTDAASIGCLPSPATMAVCRLDQADPPWQHQPASALDPRAIGLSSRNLAYVIYTSGSTGSPKGVTNEHRNAVSLLHWHCSFVQLKASDRSSCVARFGFDAAAWELWPSLCVGAALCFPPTSSRDDQDLLIDWWKYQAIDV